MNRIPQQALGYDKPKAKPITPEPQVMNPPQSAAEGCEARNQQKAHVMGIGDVHRVAEARPAEATPPSAAPFFFFLAIPHSGCLVGRIFSEVTQ